MIKKVNDELYAQLVKEAETATANGRTYTRFGMLECFERFGIEINGETVTAIERLYADGFVKE